MKYVIGNWKMNPTELPRALELIRATEAAIPAGTPRGCVAIAAPFVYLHPLACETAAVALAAQDTFWDQAGAYTGQVSPAMLKGLGVRYVLIGHSERRTHAFETDAHITHKVRAALDANLRVILAVGSRARSEAAVLRDIRRQLRVLDVLGSGRAQGRRDLLIAYEPLVAIGTGQAAPVDHVRRVAAEISRLSGAPVLYGGSISRKNASTYLALPELAGVLVGSASLRAREFAAIIQAAEQLSHHHDS
ncbi:MAG: triose-phosphate isomerase family protein [Candidatus Andersenbacteria bacterium]